MTYNDLLLTINNPVSAIPTNRQAKEVKRMWDIFYGNKKIDPKEFTNAKIRCRLMRAVQKHYPELFI